MEKEQIIYPEEKVTSQIVRGELDYHSSIEDYTVTYEQTRILYTTILVCLVTLFLVIWGF